MQLDNTVMLALGGVAAAAAAGWSQVKNAFTYLSSFILIKVRMDEALSETCRSYIRHHWKLLPSGLLIYRSRYFNFKEGGGWSKLVPFRLPANNAIYRKGFCLLFLSGDAEGMHATFLRGTLNFDNLIRDALEHLESRNNAVRSEVAKENRYQIINVLGAEKGMWSAGRGSSSNGQAPDTSLSQTSSGSSGAATGVPLNSSEDKSFLYDRSNWMFDVSEDPFKSLYFPSNVLAYIEQARQWLEMGEWYAERTIPWRRGWLLYGPGGTGKSSLAKATAQSLCIPIYQFYLSTLSDQEFIKEWSGMSTPCIALLEDFDAVFKLRESLTEHKALTFDCVLNQISGVSSTNGVFLMVSTNHIEHIDPAMGVSLGSGGVKEGISTRPGRIDTVIEFGFIERENRVKMAQRILRDWPDAAEAMVEQGEDMTPAQFQEMLVQYAYAKLNTQSHSAAELPVRALLQIETSS